MRAHRTLLIYYSLTGQTNLAVTAVAESLRAAGGIVDTLPITPIEPMYQLPLSKRGFYGDWIKSLIGRRPTAKVAPIEPPAMMDDYDLVVLGYQPWFLAPSFPVTGFMESPSAKLLNGKKVLSVITARGAWQGCFNIMQKQVEALGGQIIDNVALCSRCATPHNFLQLHYYLFRGEDPINSPLRVFGPYGVGEEGLERARQTGLRVMRQLAEGQPERSLLSDGTSPAGGSAIIGGPRILNGRSRNGNLWTPNVSRPSNQIHWSTEH